MEQQRESLWSRLKSRIVFRLLWLISTAIAVTVRLRIEGRETFEKLVAERKGGLLLTWHGVTMLPIYYCRHRGLYSIVSVSKDGELQNKLLTSRGFKTIRGSSARHGIRALLEAVRRLQEGNMLAITPDGPKGPPRQVQQGTVRLAQRSGCPVLPVGVACRPCKRLHSWDSHMLPAPFARAVIVFGDPFQIEDGEDQQEAASRIEDAINKAEHRAEELLG